MYLFSYVIQYITSSSSGYSTGNNTISKRSFEAGSSQSTFIPPPCNGEAIKKPTLAKVRGGCWISCCNCANSRPNILCKIKF